MKCPKCRRTMNEIIISTGTYWHCNECNYDVGKPSEPTIVQEEQNENGETISKSSKE